MSVRKYEVTWNNRDLDQQKELLSKWAEGKILLSTEQLLFALQKIEKLRDIDLVYKYFAYLNKFVFNVEDRSRDLISSLNDDKLITLILFALSENINKNFRNIAILKEKFPSVILDGGMGLPETKATVRDIEKSIIENLQEFTLADDTSLSDFHDYIFLLFSYQLMSPGKRYIDLMFKNKAQHPQLCKIYERIQEIKNLKQFDETVIKYEFIREISTHFLSSLKYVRENGGELLIRLANFVNIPPELRPDFFKKIQYVLKNIIAYPDPEKNTELEDHFQNISKLDDQVVSEFVAFLFKSDPGLGHQLHQKMDPKCALYGKFSKHILVNPIKIKEAPSEERVSVDGSEQDDHSTSEHSGPVDKASEEESEQAAKIETGYFNSDGWEFQLSLLAPAISNTTSDQASAELITALDKIAQHAREHLDIQKTSARAKEGQQKYGELVKLFTELGSIKSKSTEEALTVARDILQEHLDKEPKKSDLLKNRGGFFGAYKTFSKIYSKIGLLHYVHTKDDGTTRTAESTTDHLLIALLDVMNDQLLETVQGVEI